MHSAYFDVPEFRKLIMQAVSRSDGFAASPAFKTNPDYAQTAQWLAEIEAAPNMAEPVATADSADVDKPSVKDAEAVSGVVASTVKPEP